MQGRLIKQKKSWTSSGDYGDFIIPVNHPQTCSVNDKNPHALSSSRQKISCDSKVLQSRTYQRGSFWVMENYIAAQRNSVKCYESVTYTTHTDFTFLDNLVPIVDRWMAPVSVAIYGPGDDFQNAKESIFYMRNCLGNQRHMDLIRELVSFHLYFNASDMPTGDVSVI